MWFYGLLGNAAEVYDLCKSAQALRHIVFVSHAVIAFHPQLLRLHYLSVVWHIARVIPIRGYATSHHLFPMLIPKWHSVDIPMALLHIEVREPDTHCVFGMSQIRQDAWIQTPRV